MNIHGTIGFCAFFVFVASLCFSATYFVDAAGDPFGDGSEANPFDAIQKALDIIEPNDVIIVQPGVYTENLEFPGVDFVLMSTNPQVPAVVSSTIIDGDKTGRVITFAGTESPACLLTGFTIRNGYYRTFSDSDVGGGILGNHTVATIHYCVISGNYAYMAGGGIARCDGLIEHCLIDNNHSLGGSAIAECGGIIRNCVITNNRSYSEPVHPGSSGGTITTSSASIEHCVISNNVSGSGGTIVYCSGPVSNCIISGNSVLASWGYLGDGAAISVCTGDITNCTITGNRTRYAPGLYGCRGVIENCIVALNIAEFPYIKKVANCPQIRFSCFPGGSENGNIDADPLFVQNGHWDDNGTPWDLTDDIWNEGDYHLQSAGWRWNSASGQWAWDDVTSPCIDTGNPGMALGDELLPEEIDPEEIRGKNIRINMGAYGGTSWASVAPAGWALLGDFNNDGTVNIQDFFILVETWLETAQNLPADVSRDGTVAIEDYALLAKEWLQTTTWH